MSKKNPFHWVVRTLNGQPQAAARVHGRCGNSEIRGTVYFYQEAGGVLVAACVTGLPDPGGFYGFHIHSGSACAGTAEDPFEDTLAHYNPEGVPHPHHPGDLPSLLGNHGFTFQVFFTDRFCVREILRKTVVIHSGPDDFTSQPAGNAGEKIACGEIEPFGRGTCYPL